MRRIRLDLGLFERADFERLAAVLAELRGSFLLSLNDTPEVHSIFSAFSVEGVRTTYTVGRGEAKQVGGVLISA